MPTFAIEKAHITFYHLRIPYELCNGDRTIEYSTSYLEMSIYSQQELVAKKD